MVPTERAVTTHCPPLGHPLSHALSDCKARRRTPAGVGVGVPDLTAKGQGLLAGYRISSLGRDVWRVILRVTKTTLWPWQCLKKDVVPGLEAGKSLPGPLPSDMPSDRYCRKSPGWERLWAVSRNHKAERRTRPALGNVTAKVLMHIQQTGAHTGEREKRGAHWKGLWGRADAPKETPLPYPVGRTLCWALRGG